jgi:hypothetical protein
VASRPRTLHSAGAVATAPGVRPYARGRQPYRQQWQGWRSTGLAPPHNPVRSQESKSRVQPARLRGLGALAVPEQVARRHGTGTGRAAQSPPHSGRDGLPPGELVRRHRGASPGRMMAPPRRCQGIKCPRTGAGARARSALERGGPRSRAGRTLERGVTCSRESSSGPPGGPLGPSRRGPCPAWLSKAYLVLALLRVLSGDLPAV